MVLTSLIALGSSPGKILPDQAQIERMARNLGMVYREEVLPIPESPPGAPEKGEKPEPEKEYIQVAIPPGSSSQQIASLLVEKGLIQDRSAFERRVRERGVSTQLEAGQFELSPSWSIDQIIDVLLIKGRR